MKAELYPQFMRFKVDKDQWGNYYISTDPDPEGFTWDEAVEVLARFNQSDMWR